MQYTLNLSQSKHISHLKKLSDANILFELDSFSKFGHLKSAELAFLGDDLGACKGKKILDFSILVKDHELNSKITELEPYLHHFDRVRCSDPGVALALVKKNVEVEFSLEQAAPNQEVVLAWAEKLGPYLKKLVLSNQFPISEIAELSKKLGAMELELLALGPIETFYSRRKLIAKPMGLEQEEIHTTAYSDDRPNQVGRLKQNRHGTYYFHDKDLCLLGLEEKAEAAGVSCFKLSLQNEAEYQLVAAHFMEGGLLDSKLADAWPQKTTVGFFHKNRTDKPLKRLTNNSLQENANLAIGRVIEAKKNSFMVIELLQRVTQPCNLTIINPEGKVVDFTLKGARFLNGKDADENLQSGIYLLKWIKYALVQSLILPKNE